MPVTQRAWVRSPGGGPGTFADRVRSQGPPAGGDAWFHVPGVWFADEPFRSGASLTLMGDCYSETGAAFGGGDRLHCANARTEAAAEALRAHGATIRLELLREVSPRMKAPPSSSAGLTPAPRLLAPPRCATGARPASTASRRPRHGSSSAPWRRRPLERTSTSSWTTTCCCGRRGCCTFCARWRQRWASSSRCSLVGGSAHRGWSQRACMHR
jgi:hypothetical protein